MSAVPLPENPRVVVIGGGIAGLAASHRLVQGNPGSRVTLLEAEDRLGGKILTERVDGFVVEGGPDSFLAAKPHAVGLSEEVGLGGRLIGVTPRERRAFVLFRGTLHDLPEGLSGLIPTRLSPLAGSTLLSPAGKARVALDYVLPARRETGDESLGGFIRRRLGREAWDRLVEPLMAGIYAADGDRLSLAATFPQLQEAERVHGGLIRGVLANRQTAESATPGAPPRSAFLTPRGGMGELVSAIESRLRNSEVAIRTGHAATELTRTSSGFRIVLGNGDAIAADAVILATPSFVSAALLYRHHPALAGELATIPHASTAVVTLAYRAEEIARPLDGHGYVVPRREGGAILACTWSSQKWTGRAPADWRLMRVFIGRTGQEDLLALNDDALVTLAQEELVARLGATAGPTFDLVHRWPQGMPQYVLGHPERLVRIDAMLAAWPGLALAGNAYRGVGIPDCIASGERAANSAMRYLASLAVDAADQPLASVST